MKLMLILFILYCIIGNLIWKIKETPIGIITAIKGNTIFFKSGDITYVYPIMYEKPKKGIAYIRTRKLALQGVMGVGNDIRLIYAENTITKKKEVVDFDNLVGCHW